MNITVLHPGSMGVAIASSVARAGHRVFFVDASRSEETKERARRAGVSPHDSLLSACSSSDIIFSICPPHAAQSVAEEVASHGYTGIYVDANAISPTRTLLISEIVKGAGASFIDGSVIGGPPKEIGKTFIYLSGAADHEASPIRIVADCFSKGLIQSKIMSDRVGDASALKMCYAAHSKGSLAMLLATVAVAEKLGVRNELFDQWNHDEDGSSSTVERRGSAVTAKAWRYIGEMNEIADTFNSADLPEGFHRAAAEVYSRIAASRDGVLRNIEFDEVLKSLLESSC